MPIYWRQLAVCEAESTAAHDKLTFPMLFGANSLEYSLC